MLSLRPSTPARREVVSSVLMMPTWESWKSASVPALLTGLPTRQLSTQLRIRDNAAAAGLSPLWEPWRALTLLQQAGWEAMLNSNWGIAAIMVGPKAAAVDGTSMESNTSARLELPLRPATRTELRMVLVGLALFRRPCLREPSLGTTASVEAPLVWNQL